MVKNGKKSNMELLKSKMALTERVAIYVPSTLDVDKNIDNSIYVNMVTRKLCKLFGGATSYNANGSWYSDELKKVVTENVTIIYSNCTKDQLEKNIFQVWDIANDLKNTMSQECISLEINGDLYFVDSELEL